MKTLNKGFTLIELVMVIVILGILAAAAIPKFIDLSSEARISNIKSMAGAVSTGATLARSKAIIKGADVSSASSSYDLTDDGTDDSLVYGYPAASDTTLMEWIIEDMGDFTYSLSGSNGRYSLDDSCYVEYQNATDTAGPTITTETGGC